ncbi:YrrC family ATP-dependent DNA helicase, partial [Escherichia coli]
VNCEDKSIKTNKSNEVILVGDILELLPNQIYSVKANIEINKKFGIQYKVVSIKQNKPTDLDGAKTFLS